MGLHAKRIHQDLVAEHGCTGKYWAVYRFIAKLGKNTDLPFRRIEVEPGAELQVDFGTGAKIRMPDGSFKRTHVFRAVLSHSRTGDEQCQLALANQGVAELLPKDLDDEPVGQPATSTLGIIRTLNTVGASVGWWRERRQIWHVVGETHQRSK